MNAAILKRVREVDARWGDDPSRRRFEMEKIRRDFFIDWIAVRVRRDYSGGQFPDEALRREAAKILDLAGHRSFPNSPQLPRRSDAQEKFYTSAKVAWHKLLKSEGVSAARPRAKNAGPASSAGLLAALRRLNKLKGDPHRGAALFNEYVAQQARQLSEVCAHAKEINPSFVCPHVDGAVAELYRSASLPAENGSVGSDERPIPPRK